MFDAVIVTVGTCGEPNWIKLPGMPENVGQENEQKSNKAKKKSRRRKSEPTQDLDSHAEETGSQGKGDDGDSTEEKREPDHDRKQSTKDVFSKTIIHSSQLDSPSFNLKGGEKIVVIGSGASGVEAVETILDKFGSVLDSQGEKQGVEITIIARNDKWIIPRNALVDTCIAGQPFGRQMPLSFLWEAFLKYWHYHGVHELVPKDLGIYEGTPVSSLLL